MSEDYLKDLDWAFSEMFPGMFDFWNRAIPINQRYREDRRQAANRITTTGLKSIIGRPHNLSVSKDVNGNTVYKIDVVYTPFKKNDVKIELEADEVLHISAGLEDPDTECDTCTVKADKNKLVEKWQGSWNDSFDEKTNKNPNTDITKCNGAVVSKSFNDRMVYRGISKKPFSFKLYIKNLLDECCEEEIDVKNITAHAEDGILSLVLPTKKKNIEPPPGKRVSIELS